MKSHTAPYSMVLFALAAAITASAQTNNIAINNDGAAPDPSAMLDVQSNYPTTQRGLLIPRMGTGAMNAIPAPADGMVVYTTTAPVGFFYYDAVGAIWRPIQVGGSSWGLTGNGGTNPTNDYVGTTNNQSFVVRTNNVERMRLDTDGDLGIGVVAPVEKLDVAGAIRLSGTSATNNVGTIRWNGTSQYHEGNINGTPAGWKKLENDYIEVQNQPYTQPGQVTCGSPTAELGAVNAPSSNNILVTPFDNANQFSRHQYLFRVTELDLEQNQLYLNPNATQGLCPGPITKIAFYVETGVATQRPWFYKITLKHSSSNALPGAFDLTPDPAEKCICAGTGCAVPGGNLQPAVIGGWTEFDFSGDPFIWNGVDNIIIDVARAGTGGALANHAVRKTDLTFQGTYMRYSNGAACSTAGLCGASSIPGGGATSTCGAGGPSTQRPVVRWWGNASTAPVATSSNGPYITYDGGFLVEGAPGWAGWTNPPNAYYAFKGPGTIAAQNGVYDWHIRLNDHVFDRYFDGRVDASDAAEFGDRRTLSMDEMANYVEVNRHLPTMKGRSDWNKEGGFALGDLTNQLWATTETQALYLTELNDRIDVLEIMATDRPITGAELGRVKQQVMGMSDLNEAQKQALIKDCARRVNATPSSR